MQTIVEVEGEEGPGGVLLPAATLCDEPGRRPQTLLFRGSVWIRFLFVLPKREGREGKRALVFL